MTKEAFFKKVAEQENLLPQVTEQEDIAKLLDSYTKLLDSLNLSQTEMQKLLRQQKHNAKEKEKSSSNKNAKLYYERKQDIIEMFERKIELDKMYCDEIRPAAIFLTHAQEDEILNALHTLSHGVDLFSGNKNRERELVAKIHSGEISAEEAVKLRVHLEIIATAITNVSKATSWKLSMPRHLLKKAVYASVGDTSAQADIDKTFNGTSDVETFEDTEENE